MTEFEYKYIADLVDLLPEIPSDSIVSRTIYSGQDAKAIVFGFAAGQELSEHTASKPAILYFTDGEAQLTLGEERFDARPGTWVHMPAHLPHSVEAQTQTVMLLIMLG